MEKHSTIGQVLRQARQDKNVSLDDVAAKTKININLLRSLEQDDLEKLPNKTYVKGFVKNCAKILNVNTQEALDALGRTYKKFEPEQEEKVSQEEVSATAAPKKKEAPAKKNKVKEKDLEVAEMQHHLQGIIGQLFNKKILISAAALVAIVLVIKGIVGFFSSIESEKESLAQVQSEPIKPKESSLFEMDAAKKLAEENGEQTEDIEEKETDGPSEESESSADTEKSSVKEEPAAAKVDEEEEEVKDEPEVEAAKEEKPTLPAGKFPYKDFYQAPRNLFSLNGDAPELSDTDIVPESIREAMKTEGHNLFINAVEGDTWISYQVDGGDIKRYVLKKGRTLLLQAKETILIFFGNLNIAKIFYNDQLVDAKTKSGVKSLIFPEEKSTEFELPLFPSYKGVPYKQEYYKENMVEKE